MLAEMNGNSVQIEEHGRQLAEYGNVYKIRKIQRLHKHNLTMHIFLYSFYFPRDIALRAIREYSPRDIDRERAFSIRQIIIETATIDIIRLL